MPSQVSDFVGSQTDLSSLATKPLLFKTFFTKFECAKVFSKLFSQQHPSSKNKIIFIPLLLQSATFLKTRGAGESPNGSTVNTKYLN